LICRLRFCSIQPTTNDHRPDHSWPGASRRFFNGVLAVRLCSAMLAPFGPISFKPHPSRNDRAPRVRGRIWRCVHCSRATGGLASETAAQSGSGAKRGRRIFGGKLAGDHPGAALFIVNTCGFGPVIEAAQAHPPAAGEGCAELTITSDVVAVADT
jgi:hypothetical protein